MRKYYLIIVLFLFECGSSMTQIHQLAKEGRIHPDPAIYAVEEIEVNAPVDRIWELLSDIENWPTWMENATDVKLHGKFAVDTEFELTNLGMKAKSKLAIIERNQTLGWTGTASIAKTAVIWRFKEIGARKTHIIVEESIDGFLLSTFYSKEKAAQEMKKRLLQIKKAAEK